MTAYQVRMANEYKELKERYQKLHRMIIKYEAGTLDSAERAEKCNACIYDNSGDKS